LAVKYIISRAIALQFIHANLAATNHNYKMLNLLHFDLQIKPMLPQIVGIKWFYAATKNIGLHYSSKRY